MVELVVSFEVGRREGADVYKKRGAKGGEGGVSGIMKVEAVYMYD